MATISDNLVIIASFTNDLNSGVYDHLPLDPVDERCNEMNRRMQDIFDLYDSTSQQVSDLRNQVWAQWDELTRAIDSHSARLVEKSKREQLEDDQLRVKALTLLKD